MKYRKLDANGDYTFGSGLLNFWIDQNELIAQSILTRLRLWRGEWFINIEEGTPYLQAVLGKHSEQSAISAIRKRILDTQGVTGINDLAYSIDANTRKITITTLNVQTIFSESVDVITEA